MGASGLGTLLVKEGFLTEQDRVTITKTCGQGSWAFAKCILATGLLDEDELAAFFAERTKYVVAPKNLLDRLDPGIVEQIDRRMVSRLEVLPLELDHQRITVAVADPLDKSTLKQLEFFTGLEVMPVIAPLSQIHEGLSRLNPEFKARPTALSNFLRNHAGAAWIKQKVVDEGPLELSSERRQARGDFSDVDVEDVAFDEEIDALEDSSDNLNDIDAESLDEGIGNSDFDDIDLDDSSSDLELASGDDPDRPAASGSALDDDGLDEDDPFDNFDKAPQNGKAAQASAPADDPEGLEAGGDISDDLWPDADDEPAPQAAQAKAPARAPVDDLWPEGDETPDLKADDDFSLDDEPAPASRKTGKGGPATGKDEFLNDDDASDFMELQDEPGDAADSPVQVSGNSVDEDPLDSIGFDDDFEAAAGTSERNKRPVPGTAPSGEEASGDDLLDETPDLSMGADSDDALDELNLDDADPFDEPKPTAHSEAAKPGLPPSSGRPFDADEETGVALRKSMHAEHAAPEFEDLNFDDAPEETHINLHATANNKRRQFRDDPEDGLNLDDTKIGIASFQEPAFEATATDGLEDLAMGFDESEAIDEPTDFGDGPGVDDALTGPDPVRVPPPPPKAPARTGGGTAASDQTNGSLASLTATAKANEALLRMSLCFDRQAALEIAREYLPQISGTGCLVDLGKTTRALAAWRQGAAADDMGHALALQELAKAARPGEWSEIAVGSRKELFGSAKTLSVYKIQKGDGRALLLAGDYPLDDESLRDALTSFAEQLGAKQASN